MKFIRAVWKMLSMEWWIFIVCLAGVLPPPSFGVHVFVRDEKRYAVLFQSVVLPCQYNSVSTQTPVVQWVYKSYCRDRTRDSFSHADVLSGGLGGSGLNGGSGGAGGGYETGMRASYLDCADSSRTVRMVASISGSSVTLSEYYKNRDISINNKADLRIGEVQWGDSGVYMCKVVISDDLEGQNEASVELLVLARPGVEALNVDIPEDLYEFARGDNITLPCNFKPSVKPSMIIIRWSAEAEAAGAEEKLILTYYSTPAVTDISPPYEGRASLDIDVDQGKANLKLSSITMEDNKVFECRVQIPRDDEGKPFDTATLVVLVAPSVPICAVEGKKEYGQNINLTCKSEEGSPPPTYKWQGRDVRNMPRVPDPRTTDKDGILSLYNISKDTSGYYICTSSNKIRSAQCNITLAVMPPTMNLGSTGTIIRIVAGVIGLIAIIVIVYCCCRRK